MAPHNMNLGNQDMPTQNMLLWHIHYFEWVTLEKQQKLGGDFSELPLYA